MNRAILFLIFNREDTTAQVFEAIRQAKPPRLYIAADGPRSERGEAEAQKCQHTRSIALDHIDWPCEVHTLLRDQNLGCGPAVSEAIAWFFDHEPDGIILEDDCLPHPDFFAYAEDMLDRYADNPRIAFIGGNNHDFFDKPANSPSYYFSAYNHVWGWAAWRRTWRVYNYTLDNITLRQYCRSMRHIGMSAVERFYWSYLFLRLRTVGFSTWDYQLTMSLHIAGLLSIVPNHSMIKNIGFSADATHTADVDRRYIDRESQTVLPIIEPSTIQRHAQYDKRLIWSEIRRRPLMPFRYCLYALKYAFGTKR